jgi:RNA polymerase sigma factor (TIGR02999 family)
MPRAPAINAEDITGLLHAWMEGRPGALDRLMEVAQDELRRLARIRMRGERRDHTLQPTALVNEVFVKLADLRGIRWRDRVHFLSMVSRLMRRVLVDAARARDATKRGQSRVRVSLDHMRAPAADDGQAVDLLDIDEALTRLAAIDHRKARIVEVRFFGGMTVEEAAEDLGVSPETVARDWRTAKIWLRREMARKGTV